MSVQFATTRRFETFLSADSVWTLGYEVVNGKVKVHSYDRDNSIGYEQEDNLPQVDIVLNDNQEIIKVGISSDQSERQEYEVLNPQHVFSYSQVTHV